MQITKFIDRDILTNELTDSPEDQFIKIKDIFELHKQFFPGSISEYVSFKSDPDSSDACRVVYRKDIQPFCVKEVNNWVSYKDIVEAYDKYRKTTKSHNAPYKEENIFSPVSIVIADAYNPIRAAISFEPLYPIRSIVASVLPNISMLLVYTAIGVLNSTFGSGIFFDISRKSRNISKVNGLPLSILNNIPISKKDYEPEDLFRAADISYRLSILSNAKRYSSNDLSNIISSLGLRFLSAISILLKLNEGELDDLITSAPQLRRWEFRNRSDETQLYFDNDDAIIIDNLGLKFELINNDERIRIKQYLDRSIDRMTLVEINDFKRLTKLVNYEEQLKKSISIGFRSSDWTNDGEEIISETSIGLSKSNLKLITENIDGHEYKYYPIRDYIVCAPGVCGGRLTFKYTRIDVRHVLDILRSGKSIDDIIDMFDGKIQPNAIKEAQEIGKYYNRNLFNFSFL